MDLESKLLALHKDIEHIAFSWYIRKGHVPPMLLKIQDISRRFICLLPFAQNKAAAFDFVATIAIGRILLVGEGNFSFSLALTRKKRIIPENLTVTTLIPEKDVKSSAKENVISLKEAGVTVLFGVDATKLESVFGAQKFDHIIFQFPHAGSRVAIEGHNPNFILVRDFLRSAARQVAQNGQVLISAVDNPHYRGAFQFDMAAEKTGFLQPEVYPFHPELFIGYVHSMTHQDGDALDAHEAFSTWVFKLKQ